MGSTRLCAIAECPIVSPRLNDTLARLREIASGGNTLSGIDEIEAFADSADDKILLNLSAERLGGSPESIAKALRESVPYLESILIQDRRADNSSDGPGYLTYRLETCPTASATFLPGESSPNSAARRSRNGERCAWVPALDLFAGVGLPVWRSPRFDRVIGVDRIRGAST
jgi:tRNA/tmRNA/rRNA uracil-C5-methylase (TrmA/RlmC/RlmD family)